MSAVPHVLMTQTPPRAASPVAAGLKLTSGETAEEHGRSFEETLSDQSDVNFKTDHTVDSETSLAADQEIPVNDIDLVVSLNSAPLRDGVIATANQPSDGTEASTLVNDTPITIPTADIATLTNRDAALPAFVVASDPTASAAPQLHMSEDGANPPSIGTTQALPIPAEASTAPITNVATPTSTIAADAGVIKTDGAVLPAAVSPTADVTKQAEASDPDTADRPRLSDKAAETAEYRALVKPSASAPDLVKIAEAPASSKTLFASHDAPTPLKSIPVIAALPTLTPLTGMSDRLAATILQNTTAQPTVTLDKIPQAVVAIALSAKSATLQIDPPELGRIQLDYQFDSQGRTIVTLTPESEAARAALMDRMASITAALEQGANNAVEVKLGDARDFGSEFGQASQDDESADSQNSNGANDSAIDTTHTDDLQRFIRAPMGEAERLHILV
jgi:flagellar hook-length control protein FliK